jgi:hypothetical protein
MEALGDPLEAIASPTVAKRDGDRENARPIPPRHAIEVAYQLPEEVVGIEFRDDQFQESSRPCELRSTRGKQSYRTRAKFFAPSFDVELLFRANSVFQQGVDIGLVMDLAHGCTSMNRDTRAKDERAPKIAESLGRPR